MKLNLNQLKKKKPKTELPKVVSTPKELAAQNEVLRKRVEALETENWELKKKLESVSGGNKDEKIIEEIKEVVSESVEESVEDEEKKEEKTD